MSIEIGDPDADERPTAERTLPEALPVLPLRESVSFPHTLTPLAIGQERSIQLVNDVLGGERMLAMVASRDPENETPTPDDLYEVGVAGTVARMLKVPDGTLRILVQGGQRVRLTEFVATEPYIVGRIVEEPDVVDDTPDIEALARSASTSAPSSTTRRNGPCAISICW